MTTVVRRVIGAPSFTKLAVGEGIDYDTQHPAEQWRQLLSDARHLGNSGWPRLKTGKRWGTWKKKDAEKSFAKIIDALRSVYFPVVPPPKNSEKWNTPYWQLYTAAKNQMTTSPPASDELSEWKRKRRDRIVLERIGNENWLPLDRLPKVI